MGYAIDARRQRFPDESPFEYRPLLDAGENCRFDERARAALVDYNLLDLQLAVVSGSVALGFGEPFFEAAQATIDDLCRLDYSRGTRIIPAALGADAPLVGAAAVGFIGMGRELLAAGA